MQQRSNNRKEFIFNNAKKLFLELGYTDVSLRQIAEVSGTSATAIGKHFKSKQELALIIIFDFIQNVLDITNDFAKEQFPAKKGKFEKILFLWSLYYKVTMTRPSFGKFIFECRQSALSDYDYRFYDYVEPIFSPFTITENRDDMDAFLRRSTMSYVERLLTKLCSDQSITLHKSIEFFLQISSTMMNYPEDRISIADFLEQYQEEIETGYRRLLELSDLA